MESAKAAPGEKPKLEIHVCYCAQKDYDDSLRHWMLMLNNPEAVKGDWMGGPNGKQIPAPLFIVLLYTYVIVKGMFQENETNPDRSTFTVQMPAKQSILRTYILVQGSGKE